MTFEGIIFDLDGTLADTLADIAGSMNRVLRANGYLAHPVKNYKLLVGKGLDNLVSGSLPVKSRQVAVIAKCLTEMISDYSENCLVNTCLYKGIHDLLVELTKRNIKIAVFSNKAEPLTRKIVAHLLNDIKFINVIGARPDIPKKPDPAGALLISKQMEISPKHIVYMGDSDVDMITATRAGMFAVGVLWGFRTKEELLECGARALLRHPVDLLELLINEKKVNN
jgi:phosphoglycolate phosphatase